MTEQVKIYIDKYPGEIIDMYNVLRKFCRCARSDFCGNTRLKENKISVCRKVLVRNINKRE